MTTTRVRGGKPVDPREAFAKARSAAQQKVGTYLTKEEKADLADSGESFVVTAISEGSGQFGPKWTLTLLFDDKSEKRLSLPANEFRDELFSRLQRDVPLPNMVLTVNHDVKGVPYDVMPADFNETADV